MKYGIAKAGAFMALMLLSALVASADPIPLMAGSPLQALTKTNVRIASEELSVTLTLDKMRFQAVLDLENPGERTSFPVGFPCELPLKDIAGMTCDHPLKVKVGDKNITAVTKNVADYGRCWVWDMAFKKGERVRLEIEYEAPIINDRYSVPVAGVWFVHYPLRTGANWAGPIERLKISVSLPVETIVQVGPPGYVRKPGLLEWDFADHEPWEDLFVVMDPYQTSRYVDAGLTEEGESGPGHEKALAFAESFLKGLGNYQRQYKTMMEIFPRFRFPPTMGMDRVVKESYEIMRADIK